MKTTFKGDIAVSLRGQNNEDNGTVTIPVRNIFTKARGFDIDGDKNPTFSSEGTCELNLALDKKVVIKETPINNP